MNKSEIYLLPLTVRGEIKVKYYSTIKEAIEELGDVLPIPKELFPDEVKTCLT